MRWRRRTGEAAIAVVAAMAVIAAPALPPLAKSDTLPHNEKGQVAPPPSDTPVVRGSNDGGGLTAEWVKQENARPGTADWRLNGTSGPQQIEAYAGTVSATQGETVDFYVSTAAPTFHLEAYRMGYYGGLGGRLVWRGPEEAGERQSQPTVAHMTNMVEAGWKSSAHVRIYGSWVPGMYLVK